MSLYLSNSLKLSRHVLKRQLALAQHVRKSTHNQKPDRVHGSIHWNIERATAISLAPLIASSFIAGPSGITDVLLGVVLPFHIHMGFDSCITDYFNPTRANPKIYKAMAMTLHTSTMFTMIGCAVFNYRDIGMTELIARLWAA